MNPAAMDPRSVIEAQHERLVAAIDELRAGIGRAEGLLRKSPTWDDIGELAPLMARLTLARFP